MLDSYILQSSAKEILYLGLGGLFCLAALVLYIKNLSFRELFFKSWANRFGYNFSEEGIDAYLNESFLTKNDVSLKYSNQIKTPNWVYCDLLSELKIGDAKYPKAQSIFIYNLKNEVPHFIIQPITLLFQIEESFLETSSKFKYKEQFATDHLLLTDFNSEAISFVTSKFIDLMDKLEDYYIEFKHDKIIILKQDSVISVDDFDLFIEDCNEIIDSLSITENTESNVA